MSSGAYRVYFHLGKFGFKFARYSVFNGNSFLAFLCGIIQNVLEYRRYRYYVLKKPYVQGNRIWQYREDTPSLNKVYFTCGLFNIVEHLPGKCNWKDFTTERVTDDVDEKYWNEKTAYLLVEDVVPKNFRKDKYGNIYCVDYGDFSLTGYNRTRIGYIDYK